MRAASVREPSLLLRREGATSIVRLGDHPRGSEIVGAIHRIFAVKFAYGCLVGPPDIRGCPRPCPRIVSGVVKGRDDLKRPVALLRAFMHLANTIRELGVGRDRRPVDVDPKPLPEAARL